MAYNKIVLGMATLRIIFGLMGLVGAGIMLKGNDTALALQVNGVLGAIGPFILLSVAALGVIDLAGGIPYSKIAMIIVGVVLILMGTR